MDDLIRRQDAIDRIRGTGYADQIKENVIMILMCLPPAQLDFDITAKIDKAYDDGYDAGYLQGRYEWGDLEDE